jgi:hypothetical protein
MAAPKTVKTVALDGSNKDFEIPFEYLARKFVVLTLIGVDRKELVLNVDYRFTQRTIVTTTLAWGVSQGYTLMEIKRVTSATERLVDFSDGSILRASDLNTATVQALHIAEEGRDIATDTIGVNNDGNLDARGRRIVNLADAVDPGDAVTLNQNQLWAGSALNQANVATVQAGISTTQASLSTARAAAALASQNAALASQNAAKTSETNSKTSETNSKTSETNSKASENLSKDWSNKAENSVVASGLYSSFHYAMKSSASATASALSASNALTEANRAKTEADKLGNANSFMATLKTVTSPFVSWNDGWGLDAQTIATNTITPRVAGDITVQANLVAPNNTVSARNVAATNQMTEAGYRVWTSNTFDPASKLTIVGVGTLSAPVVRTKGNAAGGYGGAIEINSVLSSVAEGDGPAITMHWPNKFAAKLFMGVNGALRWGDPLGTYYNIAGKRSSGGDSQNGWTIDEDGWLTCWGVTAPINAGAAYPYTFPKAFTGQSPQIYVQATAQRGGAGEANTVVNGITLTGFSIYSGHSNLTAFQWRAYGRAA